jgi:hypothetical protein
MIHPFRTFFFRDEGNFNFSTPQPILALLQPDSVDYWMTPSTLLDQLQLWNQSPDQAGDGSVLLNDRLSGEDVPDRDSKEAAITKADDPHPVSISKSVVCRTLLCQRSWPIKSDGFNASCSFGARGCVPKSCFLKPLMWALIMTKGIAKPSVTRTGND